MGRPRLPTADKIARGNPGKRAIDRQEPDPEYLDDLTPPAWMPAAAKAIWIELAPKLRKAKVLTVIDVPALEKLCVTHARWRAAVQDLERIGVMVERAPKDGGDTGKQGESKEKSQAGTGKQVVINQLVFAESMFFKQTLAVEREFGMTPAARTRVHVDPQLTLFGGPDGADDGKQQPAEKGSTYFTGSSPAPH
jgi:P27 family predicted phage terminase small subunit